MKLHDAGSMEIGISVNDGEVIVVKPKGFLGYRAIHRDYPEIVGSGLDLPTAARDIYQRVAAKKPAKAKKEQTPQTDPKTAETPHAALNSGLWFEAPDNWPAVIYPPLHEGGIHEREQYICVHNFQPVCGFGETQEAAVSDMAQRLAVGNDFEALREKAKHIDRIRPIPEIQGLHDLLSFVLGTLDAAISRLQTPLKPPPHSEGILMGLCWALGHKGATEYILEALVKPVFEHIEFDGTETVFGEPFNMKDLAIFHEIERDKKD